jgi:hypothetical protein
MSELRSTVRRAGAQDLANSRFQPAAVASCCALVSSSRAEAIASTRASIEICAAP